MLLNQVLFCLSVQRHSLGASQVTMQLCLPNTSACLSCQGAVLCQHLQYIPGSMGQQCLCLPLQALSLNDAAHLVSSTLSISMSPEGGAASDLLSLLQGRGPLPPAWAGSWAPAAEDDSVASYADEQGYSKQVRDTDVATNFRPNAISSCEDPLLAS